MRAEPIIQETTLTRTRSPVLYEEDFVQTVIVAEMVVDLSESTPPAPLPPVPATEATVQQTQKTEDPFLLEEEWSQAKAKAIVAEHHTDTLRRGAIALGIAGIAWGSLAAAFGVLQVVIVTTIALLLACFALIYRACFQEVSTVEEID